MTDRRHFPRLDAHVLWRPLGLLSPRRPTVDVSMGGIRIYSDEVMKIGTHLEMDLLLGDASVEFVAHVVRVEVLPQGSPAVFDVALEFSHMTPAARRWLEGHLGGEGGHAPGSEARVDEEQGEQVNGVEDEYGQQNLFQPPARVPVARGPDGERHMRAENGDQEELLQREPGLNEAREYSSRNVLRTVRRRLSVLFVTPYLPSPPRFGGQMRLHGLISGLAASHDVSVLSLVDVSEDQDEALRETQSYCRTVTTVPNRRYAAGGASKRLLQLASLFSGRSYGALVHHQADFEDALDLALSREYHDIVCFELAPMAEYGRGRPNPSRNGPAFVLDEHNIEYELGKQTASAGASVVRRAYSALDWRKVRSEELRSWSKLDGCTLTSERDREILLADAPTTRTAVVPNGVDIEFFHPRRPPEPPTDTLLFFGAIDYHPNTDGLRYFLGEVFPLLRARAPRVKLSIVGRRPPPEILAHRGPDVQITGAVEDVRPHLARASIVIVPLRLGSGTRLKILEAMAMGKAVVSTTLGAEGLAVVPERDLLLADDPATFAAQIQRLLDDPKLAARIGAAGRRLVVERYSWRASVDRLASFYEEVLEARAAS